MEQNNITTVTAVETGAGSVAVSEAAAPPPKKKNTAKIVITAALACAIVVSGIFAARTFLKPDPETVIKSAVAATYSQQQKFTDKVYTEIPAAKMMFGGRETGDYQDSFSLTVKSVGGFNYAEMISAVLSGTTVSGNVTVSQSEKLSEIDLSLSHRGTHLIGADIFLSPELTSVSIPELSAQTFSVVPSSLAEDYKNSIFYNPYVVSDGDIELIQNALVNAFENRTLTSADIKIIESDIITILAKSAANAQYGQNSQTGLYTVTIPGSDVKSAVTELCRYIYADSKLADIIRSSVNHASMKELGFASYDEAVNAMLTQLDAELPELAAVIELDIAKNSVRKAAVTLTPAESTAEVHFSDIVTELAFSPSSCFAHVSMTVTDNGKQATVFSTAQSSLENGVYSASFIIDVLADDVSVSVPCSLSLSNQGDLDYQLSIDMSAGETQFISSVFADGTAVAENGVLRYDIPVCTADFTSDGQTYHAEFSLSGSSGPVTVLPSSPVEHTAVFSMSGDDVEMLSHDIKSGLSSLIGKLNAILMGK